MKLVITHSLFLLEHNESRAESNNSNIHHHKKKFFFPTEYPLLLNIKLDYILKQVAR